MPGRSRSPRVQGALRGALAAAVVAGYLAGVAVTPAGQGLRLLAHLASAHAAAPLAAPALAAGPSAEGLPVLPTLRVHRHGGGAAHHHGPHAEAPRGGSSLHRRAAPVRAHAEGSAHDDATAGGVHEHGGVLHSHGAPPPEPAVVATVSLDKHRRPEAPPVPLPPLPTDARFGSVGAAPASAPLSVETPPPVGRGGSRS